MHGTDNFTPDCLVTTMDGDLLNPSDEIQHSKVRLVRQDDINYTMDQQVQEAHINKYLDDQQTYREVLTNASIALSETVKKVDSQDQYLIICDGPSLMAKGIDHGVKSVMGILQELNIDWQNNPEFKLTGFSRGAISCRVLSHLIGQLYQQKLLPCMDESDIDACLKNNPIELLLIDPVPGPAILHQLLNATWLPEYLNSLPDYVTETTILANDEKTITLDASLPVNWRVMHEKGKFQLIRLPGHHMTPDGCTGKYNNVQPETVSIDARQSARKLSDYVYKLVLYRHGLSDQFPTLQLNSDDRQSLQALAYNLPFPCGVAYYWQHRQVSVGFNGIFSNNSTKNITEFSPGLDHDCIKMFDEYSDDFNKNLANQLAKLEPFKTGLLKTHLERFESKIRQLSISAQSNNEQQQLKISVVKLVRFLSHDITSDEYLEQAQRLKSSPNKAMIIVGAIMIALGLAAFIAGCMVSAPVGTALLFGGMSLMAISATYSLSSYSIFQNQHKNDLHKQLTEIGQIAMGESDDPTKSFLPH